MQKLALLNSIIPNPKNIRVRGQGKGHPFMGLGRWVIISAASSNNKTPAIVRSIREVSSILHPPLTVIVQVYTIIASCP